MGKKQGGFVLRQILLVFLFCYLFGVSRKKEHSTLWLKCAVAVVSQQDLRFRVCKFLRKVQCARMIGAVDGDQHRLFALFPNVGAQIAVYDQRDKLGVDQKGMGAAQLTELLEPLHQLLIFISPRIAAAIKGVCIPAQSRLVPIVQAGGTRQKILQAAGHF